MKAVQLPMFKEKKFQPEEKEKPIKSKTVMKMADSKIPHRCCVACGGKESLPHHITGYCVILQEFNGYLLCERCREIMGGKKKK